MGLNAGNDIDLYSEIAYSRLPRLAKDNPKVEAQMDEAVRRVLRVKFQLGLFGDPYIDVETVTPNVRNAESLALAYEADLESVILLKNEDDILPLDVSGKTISLIGPLMRDAAQQDYQEVFGKDVNIISEVALQLTDEQLS